MISHVVFSAKSDEWRTPPDLYGFLDAEFGFDDDPCPLGATDGLVRPWGKRVFVNPPYSNVRGFLDKALDEITAGRTEVAVFLVAARTDTRWWHEVVLQHAREIRFIRGRLKFGGARTSAPFASVVVVIDDRSTSRAAAVTRPEPHLNDAGVS